MLNCRAWVLAPCRILAAGSRAMERRPARATRSGSCAWNFACSSGHRRLSIRSIATSRRWRGRGRRGMGWLFAILVLATYYSAASMSYHKLIHGLNSGCLPLTVFVAWIACAAFVPGLSWWSLVAFLPALWAGAYVGGKRALADEPELLSPRLRPSETNQIHPGRFAVDSPTDDAAIILRGDGLFDLYEPGAIRFGGRYFVSGGKLVILHADSA